MTIYNFTPSVKLLIHVIHIEGWFCHLCLCYKNKYSVRSFVNEFWLKLKRTCKTSSDRKNYNCLLLVLNTVGFFLPYFLKFLVSFSWNSCSAKICRINYSLFFFLLTSVQYSLSAQTELLTNRLQVGEKRFFSQPSVHSSDLRGAWQSYPTGSSTLGWQKLAVRDLLEDSREGLVHINFSVIRISSFQISQLYRYPFNLPITRILIWNITVTSTEHVHSVFPFLQQKHNLLPLSEHLHLK